MFLELIFARSKGRSGMEREGAGTWRNGRIGRGGCDRQVLAMADIKVEELRAFCAILQLSPEGTRPVLITKLRMKLIEMNLVQQPIHLVESSTAKRCNRLSQLIIGRSRGMRCVFHFPLCPQPQHPNLSS